MSEEKKKPILLVMAAGMGSRYGGSKQTDPVGSNGEIIMDFSLYDAMLAGFERVVFVIKEEMEKDFRKFIEERAGRCFETNFAIQKMDDVPDGYEVPEGRIKPWGTAHAIYSARDYLDAPFCVINADDYYGPGAFQCMYEFLEDLPEEHEGKSRYAMVAFQLDKTLTEHGHVSRGVCEVSDKSILEQITERTKIMWRPESDLCKDEAEDDETMIPAFTEDDGKTWTELSPDTPVSMNFWGFERSFIDEIVAAFPEFLDAALEKDPLKGEYQLPSVVEKLIASDKAEVFVLHSGDKWFGVTYKEDKEMVVNALQSMKDKGLYPDKLWR